jgi:predicted CXXCH cytochrome family protein
MAMVKANRKLYLFIASFLAALAVFSAAHANIAGTPHDLGGGICEYCHTPAASGPPVPQLWTHQPPSKASFTMYDSPMTTLETSGQPHGVSLVCLACHDGVTSPNALLKNSAPVIGRSRLGIPLVLGQHDPTSRHPISVNYDSRALGTDFNVTSARHVGGLPLFRSPEDAAVRSRVECASCHNPHDMTFGRYLRMENTRSEMCLTCHNL